MAKDLGTTYSTVYIREYIYVQSFPFEWNVFSLLCSRDASYGTGGDVAVYNVGGIQKFVLLLPSGWIASSVIVSPNTWYCMELEIVSGTGTGAAYLYVDGILVLSSTSETINPVRYVYAGVNLEWAIVQSLHRFLCCQH